jgi:hypothetical protein
MKQLNNKKKKKIRRKGFLFIAVGAVLITLASFVYVLLVSFLTGAVIEARHGDEVAYALMSVVTPSYGYVSLFFIAILAIWAFVPTEEELKKQNQGLSPMLGQKQSEGLSKRSLWLITGGLVAAVVVTGAISVNTYKLITPDGIRNYFFVETKSYEWKQVTGYTIDCENENDGLSVTFTMRDGKQIEILQGVNSTTEQFDEQYTSVTHFAYDLDQRMVELQVPRNARHVERAAKLYKDTTLWPYVQKLIGYAELVPEPDETSPETESDSLPASETADPTN